MRKHLLSLLLIACTAISAGASGSIVINGDNYIVDTLFHNVIGPGTTQTSLWIHNGSINLRTFYTTVDLSNPYTSMECIIARDHMAQCQNLESMARHHTSPGHTPFIGVNGDFFINTGVKTIRGEAMYGAPVGPTVCDGNVMLTRPDPTNYMSFTADKQGQVYVGNFDYNGTFTDANGNTAHASAINPVQGTPENNAITIYNSFYYSSSNVLGGCEVTAVLADGETFQPSGSNTFIITSAPDTQGDMLIPENGFVLHARGSQAVNFLSALGEGDQISLVSQCTTDGINVDPDQVISGFPRILSDGIILDTESERADGPSRHPRTSIGYSDGGQKVYMLVVDGRQTLSAGIRTSGLAAIIRYAGATEAMNLDGGGSSTLYSTVLGERNNPCEGTMRAVGNAIFAVSSAPNDNTIAEIRFQDYKLTTPRYGVYSPHFFGYNQYGMLVDTDVKGVTLSCPEGFGKIKNDTTFFASGIGTDLLTGHLGDITVSMPMVIVGEELDNMSFVNDSIITDGLRDQIVDVQSLMNGTAMPLSSEALLWESLNSDIVTIDTNTGILRGLRDGSTNVIGTVDGITDTLLVNVEIPKAHVMSADALNPDTWTFTMRCGKDGAATPLDNGGFQWDYTGTSGRLPCVTMKKSIRLWSLPDTIRLRFNNGNVPVKQAVFSLYAGAHHLSTSTVVLDDTTQYGDKVIELPSANWIDPEDMSNFPITLSGIQLDLSSSTKDKAYSMTIKALETVYSRVPDEPAGIKGDLDGSGIIDVEDVNAMINIILKLKTISEYPGNGDMDNNGFIDVEDVNAVINIILKL
ncbi:MAG: phosphodiester glycosidase family protein [Muribaculaceae bacterium]|nr:phosphodiester glycosidase family protein [Muribaculaceae bacterium]